MAFHPVIPILRSFDEAKAREFYVDWLGFRVDWEHRFEPALPLYMQVSRGDCILHLSEHHGDATPGSAVRIRVDELDAFHAELTARPGRARGLQDPSGNRLIFYRPL
jgi:catechol 2,3-dioxygenase-like lactoylglutathione lyase family enzyme